MRTATYILAALALGYLAGFRESVRRAEKSHECVAMCLEVTAKMPEVNR